MRYHWFARSCDSTLDGLVKLSNLIEDSGYHSVLFVYHSRIEDYLIKIARTMEPQHKFKYMIAMRTYAISPEYLYMIYESFQKISPNRLMFNIISGDIKEEESSVKDSVFIEDLINTSEKRNKYTHEWLKKFNNLTQKFAEKPEIVVAGHSKQTKDLASKYGYIQATSLEVLDDYIIKNNGLSKKQMMSLVVIIRDSENEAREYWESLGENQRKFSIYGDSKSIIYQFNKFEEIGINELLICNLPEDQISYYKMHDIIKSITRSKNGI